MRGKYEKPRQKLRLLRILIYVIASAIFLYSAYQLFSYWSENNESRQGNNSLIQQAVSMVTAAGTPAGTEPSAVSAEPVDAQGNQENTVTIPLHVDFDILQRENPDIIAWIYCEGTPINYPVVQGEDNQYYLKRLTDGSYNANGTIFADFRNDADFGDLNTIIYGHNMTNDSMFGTLTDYKTQAYYDEHPQFWILTREKAYQVELIAGYVTASDSDAYKLFATQEDLHAHLEEAVRESTFVANHVDVDKIERVVTLSTCSYEYTTARYVVIGSLIPVDYLNVPAND